MEITKKNISIFKQHIIDSGQYVGGSTRDELSAKINGNTFYKLSSNENLLGPSPRAVDAIIKNLSCINEYHFQGDEILREALTGFFENKIRPNQFITANSGLELIELIIRGFIDPGLECIISTPTFLAYKNFAEIQGGKVVDIPLLRPGFGLDVKGILDAVNDKTRLLFVANPNNPTGSCLPKETMDYLMKRIPSHVVVVYDEVYRDFVQSDDYPRAHSYINDGKKIIGIHSFSKAYGLAGLRLGYAFSTPEISTYLSKIRRPFMINCLSVKAGIAALDDREHIQTTRELIAQEKYWLYGQLTRLSIKFYISQANFILMLPPISSELFVAKLMEENVLVRTTDVFGLSGHIRVTVGTHEANQAFINACVNIKRNYSC